MNNLEELKKKYEELGKEIKRLENRKRWRAEYLEDYYYVDENGEINSIYENDDDTDKFNYKIRNYFKTEEEAKAHLDRLNTYYELMDLAEELNNGEEINWSNTSKFKYSIYFDTNNMSLEIFNTLFCNDIGQIYCYDENFLEKAKERIGEARLKGLFGG